MFDMRKSWSMQLSLHVNIRSNLSSSFPPAGHRLAGDCGRAQLATMADEQPLLALAEQDEGAGNFSIYDATVISFGKPANTWIPSIQVVDGKKFLCLSKWDRQLTMFCTQRSMNLHASGPRPVNHINVAWFEEMKRLRLESCNAALKKVLVEAADAAGMPHPTKIRNATPEDAHLVGRVVVVQAPPVVANEMEIMPGRSMYTLWDIRGDLWLHLTQDNLTYIRAAINNSPPWHQPASKRKKKVDDAASPKKRRKRGRKPHRSRESSDAPVEDVHEE